VRARAAAALSAMAMIALVALAAPGVALADCVAPPPLEKAVLAADIVFVGTVTSTENGNRWATVAVKEVWRGPDQPPIVLVKGGPAGNTATSVDRSFETGATYLFTPSRDADGSLSDNVCSPTTLMSEAVAPLRPADARGPTGAASEAEASGFDFGGLLGPIGVAVIVAGVLLLVGLLARGRQDA
jgi:hypothetical protein